MCVKVPALTDLPTHVININTVILNKTKAYIYDLACTLSPPKRQNKNNSGQERLSAETVSKITFNCCQCCEGSVKGLYLVKIMQ